jgi:hypothetical protein
LVFYDNIGNTEAFPKQLSICQELGFPTPPFEVFKCWKPKKHIQLLLDIRKFVEENRPVTVRQVYYHFVSTQDLKSKVESYNLIIRLLTKARLCGFIKFIDWIVDDTRRPDKTPNWSNINEILDHAIKQYRSDWQKDQPNYVEVWLEKRTLRRVFLPITDSYDLNLCVGGGYQSTDMVDNAAERMRERARRGQTLVILYFGDLNPSGKDMPRDIQDRLATLGVNVQMKEVALTKEDVEKYELPRNPTKSQDSRNKRFKEKYKIDYSVELDALSPQILRDKIDVTIRNELDLEKLRFCQELDKKEKWKAWEKLYGSG